MRFRTFGKNAFFLVASQAFGAATTLIFVPLLARYLGIANYGQYAYVYAFVGIFETLSVFGLHPIFVREVARKRDRASIYLGNILQLKAPLSLGVFVLIYLASNLFVTPDLRLLIMICASEVLLRKFFMINIALCRAFERMEYEFVVTVVERIVAVTGVLLAIKFDWGLRGIFLAFFFAAAAHSLFGTSLIWGRLVRPKFLQAQGLKRSLLLDAWPLGLSREAEVLYNRMGTVLLGQWYGPQVVGAYSGGYRIYQIASLVAADSISRSAFPALSRLNHDPRRFTHSFYRVARLNVLVGLLLAISIWTLAPIAVRVLLGPEFEPSVSVLRWISIAIPFTFLNRLLGVALQSTDHQHMDGFLTIGAFLVNLVLNWRLIPSLGATGAVLALVIAEVLSFGAKGFALVTRGLPRVQVGGETQSRL